MLLSTTQYLPLIRFGVILSLMKFLAEIFVNNHAFKRSGVVKSRRTFLSFFEPLKTTFADAVMLRTDVEGLIRLRVIGSETHQTVHLKLYYFIILNQHKSILKDILEWRPSWRINRLLNSWHIYLHKGGRLIDELFLQFFVIYIYIYHVGDQLSSQYKSKMPINKRKKCDISWRIYRWRVLHSKNRLFRVKLSWELWGPEEWIRTSQKGIQSNILE